MKTEDLVYIFCECLRAWDGSIRPLSDLGGPNVNLAVRNVWRWSPKVQDVNHEPEDEPLKYLEIYLRKLADLSGVSKAFLVMALKVGVEQWLSSGVSSLSAGLGEAINKSKYPIQGQMVERYIDTMDASVAQFRDMTGSSEERVQQFRAELEERIRFTQQALEREENIRPALTEVEHLLRELAIWQYALSVWRTISEEFLPSRLWMDSPEADAWPSASVLEPP